MVQRGAEPLLCVPSHHIDSSAPSFLSANRFRAAPTLFPGAQPAYSSAAGRIISTLTHNRHISRHFSRGCGCAHWRITHITSFAVMSLPRSEARGYVLGVPWVASLRRQRKCAQTSALYLGARPPLPNDPVASLPPPTPPHGHQPRQPRLPCTPPLRACSTEGSCRFLPRVRQLPGTPTRALTSARSRL